MAAALPNPTEKRAAEPELKLEPSAVRAWQRTWPSWGQAVEHFDGSPFEVFDTEPLNQ